MKPEVEILKSDARGRVRYSAEHRQRVLEEFERSGMSGAKFAQYAGVKYGTFAHWAQRRRREKADGRAKATEAKGAMQLIEAVVSRSKEGEPALTGLELELAGGMRLRIRDLGQLKLAAALLRELGQC
jgi:transposase-like protein